jgi:hypothetical protein
VIRRRVEEAAVGASSFCAVRSAARSAATDVIQGGWASRPPEFKKERHPLKSSAPHPAEPELASARAELRAVRSAECGVRSAECGVRSAARSAATDVIQGGWASRPPEFKKERHPLKSTAPRPAEPELPSARAELRAVRSAARSAASACFGQPLLVGF